MTITSTFVQPMSAANERIRKLLAETGDSGVDKVQLFVFDTRVGEKNIVTGVTIGTVKGEAIDEVEVSPIGMAVIECMTAHHALNYPDREIVIASLQQVGGAEDRVREVLRQVPSGFAVLFVCEDGKVYDAATPGLNVDYSSAHQDLH
jgi:hypothetical protein